MSLEVLIPKGFSATSTRLVEMLREDLDVDAYAKYTFKDYDRPRTPPTARVCWGIEGRRDGLPELNAKASTFNKIDELRRFRRAGIPAPSFWTDSCPADESLYPILGRMRCHSAGEGIVLFNNSREALNHPCEFYTRVIPSVEEYRIWVYKTKHLGSYLRTKRWPVKKTGFGRNWWNGWAFDRMDNGPAAAIEYAKIAIATMGLDFAGVDVLKGRDGHYYVLELNTSPGAETYCQRALYLLAQNIKEWYQEEG